MIQRRSRFHPGLGAIEDAVIAGLSLLTRSVNSCLLPGSTASIPREPSSNYRVAELAGRAISHTQLGNMRGYNEIIDLSHEFVAQALFIFFLKQKKKKLGVCTYRKKIAPPLKQPRRCIPHQGALLLSSVSKPIHKRRPLFGHKLLELRVGKLLAEVRRRNLSPFPRHM